MVDLKRRKVLNLAIFGSIFSFIPKTNLLGNDQRKVSQVVWGGLGFSVPNSKIPTLFPNTSLALGQLGESNESSEDFKIGFSRLSKAFVGALKSEYTGGVLDPDLIDSKSDPGLLFVTALDFEQKIDIPTKGNEFIEIGYLFGASQVFYVELPTRGGSDGELRILYSFPHRVGRSDGIDRSSTKNYKGKVFRELLLPSESNPNEMTLVDFFQKKLLSKNFDYDRPIGRARVVKASISQKAGQRIAEYKVGSYLNEKFLGQCLSASLAEYANISLLPYGQNDLLNRGLAQRFTKRLEVEKIFDGLSDPANNNFNIELNLLSIFRKANGSNVGSNLYARGVQYNIKIFDTFGGNRAVLDKDIYLVNNAELPKSMLENMIDYDIKEFVQLTIALFDSFAKLIVSGNVNELEKIGIKNKKDIDLFNQLNKMLEKCRIIS